LKTCGLTGVLHAENAIGIRTESGVPVIDEGSGAWKEADISSYLSKTTPTPNKPVFIGFKCIVAGFGRDGYTRIKRQMQKLETEYPGRYVFLLPKDLFATMRAYYRLPQVP
jgi:hypothetical protein